MRKVFNTNVLCGWRDSFHKYLPKVASAIGVKKPYMNPTTEELSFKISTRDAKIIETEVKKINKEIKKKNNGILASNSQKSKKDDVIKLKELKLFNKILIPSFLKVGFEFKNDIESSKKNLQAIDSFFTNLIQNHKVLTGTPLYNKLQDVEVQFKKYL